MTRPVIGLTCYLEPAQWGAWELPAALIPQWYVDLFQGARADVILLPPGNDPSVLDRIDGLALAGGADVDAGRYGEERHATADAPRQSRDASELGLYRAARDRRMPVLGICRGMQVMAVAHGGALVQDLPELATGLVHRERPGEFVDHSATFIPGSLAAATLGPGPFTVNSSHHQAVSSAGDLVVSGWAADGTVEVIEDPRADFCLGVQWHPEHPDRRVPDAPLLAAFVAAASRYAAATGA
ncbi:MAG: gamma-glutamyl-gamma-aminobutyrate hydrolase family protein [Candidatus Nanopelagicales bacterium]